VSDNVETLKRHFFGSLEESHLFGHNESILFTHEVLCNFMLPVLSYLVNLHHTWRIWAEPVSRPLSFLVALKNGHPLQDRRKGSTNSATGHLPQGSLYPDFMIEKAAFQTKNVALWSFDIWICWGLRYFKSNRMMRRIPLLKQCTASTP